MVESNGAVEELDRCLADFEVAAVAGADPTDGAVELLKLHRAKVGIASNNSMLAIRTWLDRRQLDSYVLHVQGRDPRKMKPNPHSLIEAARSLQVGTSDCVFIGDSVSAESAATQSQ